jgi:hypothetical protein
MRSAVLVCAAVLLSIPALSGKRKPAPSSPDHFEIGRKTSFDVGPPFNYYEVFIVRSKAKGASVDRIMLTPAADMCFAPAKVETASGSIDEPVASLLGSNNPCTIPEKDLRHELTRDRHQLVFSFADVVMQVQCGTETRLLRSHILDKDMFDPAANTPSDTSWTMGLLRQLDEAVGLDVMDKPSFPTVAVAPEISDSETLRELGAGRYDALFQDTNFKLSDLYKEAAQPHPSPVRVELVKSAPNQPNVYVPPEYPPLAKMARIQGEISFVIGVDASGDARILAFQSGHPLLRGSVQKAVPRWKFPADAISYQVQATIEFALNCGDTQHR